MWKALIQVWDSTNWKRGPPSLNFTATTIAMTSVASVASSATCLASRFLPLGVARTATDPTSGIAPSTVK